MNNEIAALRARLYITPDINEVYEMTPALPLENGWYVMDQVPTIRLKGYEKAMQVQFMAGLTGEQFPPVILGVDQDQLWTEVRDENGNTVQTPVIPVVSKVTAIKAADKFNDIVEPDKVVAEYYKLTSNGDYQSAWELIHSSERDHPSSGAKNVIRQQFLALQGTKGPALDKILGSNLKDTYKIYVIQILASDVMELKLKLGGGEEKKSTFIKR